MIIKKGKCRYCGDVVVHINKPNHILHLLLSICTGGLWILIWFKVAKLGVLNVGQKRENYSLNNI